MLFVKRASIFTLLLPGLVALVAVAVFVWSGMYNRPGSTRRNFVVFCPTLT